MALMTPFSFNLVQSSASAKNGATLFFGTGLSSLQITRRQNSQQLLVATAQPLKKSVAMSSKNACAITNAYNSGSPNVYLPDAKFYKIEAILRPWRVPHVSSALLKMGIRGVTVSDVKGFGAQGGLSERHAGSEFSEDKFLAKVKMEIVVSKEQVEVVIDKIIEEARTGEIGDGKIFLMPVADVIRVRTGERGEKAERMVGGRSDLYPSVKN